jgi:hypothetical protein
MGSPLARHPPSVLTGNRPPISVSPLDHVLLLAVLAEAVLGHVHDLGAGLGVLQLGEVDVLGAHAGHLERGLRRVDGGAGVVLDRDRRGQHLEAAERRVRTTAPP